MLPNVFFFEQAKEETGLGRLYHQLTVLVEEGLQSLEKIALSLVKCLML